MQPKNSAHRVKWWYDFPLVAFSAVFVIALVVVIVLSSISPLHPSVQYVFQVITLAAGVLGSYRFGRHSARDAAYDVIRPHARSALRSVLTLHDSLQRLARRIEGLKTDSADRGLDLIQAIVEEQIPLGSSAVEDWRDVAPDDVEEVIRNWPPDWRSQSDDNSN